MRQDCCFCLATDLQMEPVLKVSPINHYKNQVTHALRVNSSTAQPHTHTHVHAKTLCSAYKGQEHVAPRHSVPYKDSHRVRNTYLNLTMPTYSHPTVLLNSHSDFSRVRAVKKLIQGCVGGAKKKRSRQLQHNNTKLASSETEMIERNCWNRRSFEPQM